MRARRVVAVLLVLLGCVGLAAAHINDVSADTQVSANGSVVVESTLALTDGYAVVHRVAADGDPGEAIGHVRLEPNRAYTDLTVPIDEDVWAQWGESRQVWVVLHREGGGAGFDPDQDPIQRGFGASIPGDRITLGKGDPAAVTAEGFGTQRTTDDTVRIRRVVLPEAGTLTIQRDLANGTGPVVGARSLPTGVHRNVTVTLADSVFTPENRSATLLASLSGPDGATPLRVGGDPIATYLTVRQTNGSEEPLVVTPTPTTDRTSTERTRRPTTAADGPGFAAGLALLALSLFSWALLGRGD